MDLPELIAKNFSAFIAGTFTLLGTTLGWLLNSLSKKGNLKLIDKKCRIEPVNGASYGSKLYRFEVDLWVYNSSDSIKPINDIKLKITAHGKTYLADCSDASGPLDHYNFNPKQITKILLGASQIFSENYLAGDFDKVIFTFRQFRKLKQFPIYHNYIYSFLSSTWWTKFKRKFKSKAKKENLST